jgi:hypothetical protein
MNELHMYPSPRRSPNPDSTSTHSFPSSYKKQITFFASRSKTPSKAHRIHEEFSLNFHRKMLPFFFIFLLPTAERKNKFVLNFSTKYTRKMSFIDELLNAVIYVPRNV